MAVERWGPTRRAAPMKRRTLRHPMVGDTEFRSVEELAEHEYAKPRQMTPEVGKFLEKGMKRRGTYTARETGARQLAAKGEVERLTKVIGFMKKEGREAHKTRLRRMT